MGDFGLKAMCGCLSVQMSVAFLMRRIPKNDRVEGSKPF